MGIHGTDNGLMEPTKGVGGGEAQSDVMDLTLMTFGYNEEMARCFGRHGLDGQNRQHNSKARTVPIQPALVTLPGTISLMDFSHSLTTYPKPFGPSNQSPFSFTVQDHLKVFQFVIRKSGYGVSMEYYGTAIKLQACRIWNFKYLRLSRV